MSNTQYALFDLILFTLYLVVLILILYVAINTKIKITNFWGTSKTTTKSVSTVLPKNFILQEIHHRIKNNLQIIVSLMNIELEEGKSINLEDFVKKSQTNIVSIALIHKILSENNGLNRIDFKSYLTELTNNIKAIITISDEKLHFKIDTNNIELETKAAINVGLIVNELIMNSYKYAFDNQAEKIITISISENNGQYDFHYCDNGKGYNAEKKYDSIGMNIIEMLIKQLQGNRISNPSISSNYNFNFPNH